MAPVKPFIAVSYVLFIFVHTSVLCQGLLLLISYSPSASDQWLLQLIPLILVKLCTIATLSYLTACNLTRHLTQAQLLADWNLIYLAAVVIPVANLNFFFNLPTFDVTMQSWPMFLIFLIALGGCAAELPTTHTIILWLMAAPIMMFLDFKKHVAAVSEGRKWMSKPDQHIVPPAVFPGGSTNLFVEPLNSEAGDPHFQHHDVSSYLAPSSLLPFETFGIYIVRRLGLAPLLLYIDTQLQALMNIIPHCWSVLLVCAPLGALYLLRILVVGRVNKNSSMSIRYISDEEWLLVLMVFFLLGRCRESYKTDTGPLLHSFSRSRLSASQQAILCDMLPSHIVDQMMHNLSSTHQPLAPATVAAMTLLALPLSMMLLLPSQLSTPILPSPLPAMCR
ncbi:hypothetical protein CEUSTIGMA_g5703.t1 [Chlamydomonas eustigma]|uniref:Uncharacterized protein n=1 Tax=Chlamydomonas eustigma TaxID=1157962 RepID=A0A250X5A6_9CHLO|nr:hypothetical protein CEUSTIGMA_g5703.t1 [Chlamydomonas eustigma]|eukprot:GAX78261.1 hypothetical protein CEUSTIGMA_g5703.t1 [Chlamydomonas eustigma]